MQPATLATLLFLITGSEPARPPSKAATTLANLGRDYGIDIRLADAKFEAGDVPGFKIKGKPIDHKLAGPFVEVFAKELALYPRELSKRVRLKRIVFCSELRSSGTSIAGVSDWERDTIYYDVGKLWVTDESCQQVAMHHEIMHIFDVTNNKKRSDDERWSTLNPKAFDYGRAKSRRDVVDSLELTDEFPGFLDMYSTASVSEDKAETYSRSVVQPAYMEKRCERDAIVRAKVDHVKNLVGTICPEMKDGFWERARKQHAPPK